jgi:hypothetical protein
MRASAPAATMQVQLLPHSQSSRVGGTSLSWSRLRLPLQLKPFLRKSDRVGARLNGVNSPIQFSGDDFGASARLCHPSKDVILLWRPPAAAAFDHGGLFPLRQTFGAAESLGGSFGLFGHDPALRLRPWPRMGQLDLERASPLADGRRSAVEQFPNRVATFTKGCHRS